MEEEYKKKTCSKCGEDKFFWEFYRAITTFDGLTKKCSACMREEARNKYKDDPTDCLKPRYDDFKKNSRRKRDG
jgi:NAD-dependent SIR2 family protein deacetylase